MLRRNRLLIVIALAVSICAVTVACAELPPQPTVGTPASAGNTGSAPPKTSPPPTSAPPTSSPPTSAPTTTTKPDGPGTTSGAAPGMATLRVALDLVERTYPAGTKAQVSCVADRLTRQPDLVVPAQSALDQLDMATRKKVIDLLADCIGPELLLVLYEAQHPVSQQLRQCTYRALALDRPLDEAVNIVAGDPEPAQRFAQELTRLCPGPNAASTVPAATP